MASPTSDVGQGFSLSLQNGTATTNIFTCKVLGFQPPAMSREVAEVLDVNEDVASYVLGRIKKLGELKLKVAFNPDFDPPVDAAAGLCTLTFNSGATWTFTGGMTAFEPGDMTGDNLMEADTTIKPTTDITVTPAS